MIYSNVVAKYYEGRLLDAEKLRRVAEADYLDALKMLYDYGYGEGIPIENADAQKLADNETNRLFEFVEEYATSDKLKSFLLLRYLYNNVKAAVKSRFTTVEDGAYFTLFTEETQSVKEGRYDALGAFIKAALQKIDERVEKDGCIPSQAIDNILNEAYYQELLSVAKKISRHLAAYVVRMIDGSNLLTVMRAKRVGLGETELNEMLLPCGKIAVGTLVAMLTAEGEAFIELSGEYAEEAEELLGGDFALYEKNQDDRLFAVMVKDREDMLSFDPFIGYFFAKKREIEAVKLILTCIKNDARGEIRRRLRNLDE